jgi:hydrogenase nickel incorporation protein HypA/HybF
MHELAVTESILSIALEHAQKANATKVTDINLLIGQLSSIIDDSISFYWEIISKDTICSEAAIHFNRVSARMKCNACLNEYSMENELTPCPSCNSSDIQILSGNEFRVDSIEVLPGESA